MITFALCGIVFDHEIDYGKPNDAQYNYKVHQNIEVENVDVLVAIIPDHKSECIMDRSC